MKKNNVVGTWNLISGYLDNHGKRIDVLGPRPSGMVIFTEDLHFMVIVHNPDIPKFVSGDRLNGTPEEYKTAVTSSLGIYGTYTIDENGDFLEQHVIGSTFQNMNGSSRGRDELTEKVDGNKMSETLKIADEVTINLVWQRTQVNKKTIVVIGATGSQGKGLVNALVNERAFNVRAITRNPEKYSGKAHEVVFGDLNNLQSLKDAFKNAYGVFAVTNFWEGADEIGQGKNAVDAAKAAGIEHFVWSTLPNVESISNGEFEVPHFTQKAKVDDLVRSAGFKYYTFVQPPFYFQNFIHLMAPQPKQDGSTGWTLPIDPTKKAFHMADINDLGKVVTGALLQPEKVGNGAYLSLATELNSFNDILEAFKENGKDYTFTQVPPELFSSFFEGAKETAAMLRYFEKHTYMGPNSKPQIELAKEIAIKEFVPFQEWISHNN